MKTGISTKRAWIFQSVDSEETCLDFPICSTATPDECIEVSKHGNWAFLISILADVYASIGGGSGWGSNPRPSVLLLNRIGV